MKKIVSLILLLFSSAVVLAQTTGTIVRGEIYSSDGKAIEQGEVVLLQSDTISAAAMTNAKGKFEIRNLPAGAYMCQVSAHGFKDKVESLTVKGDKLNLPRIVLQKDTAVMLGELTVTAEQRLRTKNQAGMTVYQLSSRAKQENDAYMALQEIPTLRVNSVERRITLDDGSTPLILIDGVKRQGYLDALKPDMIESVEVIDNPPARYRANSKVSSVLNIKLKSRTGIKPYFNGTAYVALMPDLRKSNERLSLALGTATSSLSISGNYTLNHKIKNESYNYDLTPTLERSVLNNYRATKQNITTTINADKIFNKKNYLLFNFYYLGSPDKSCGNLTGELINPITNEKTSLTGSTYSKGYFHMLQADLYYKHNFSDSHLLEITGDYTFSNTGTNSLRKEINDWNPYESKTDEDFKRHMENLKIDYSIFIEKAGTLQAGSSSKYSLSRSDDIFDDMPLYKHKEFDEYIYAGFNNYSLQKKFSYSISLGMDIVSRNSGGAKYSYADFVPSLALGYAIGNNHYLNFNYSRSRILPNMWQLNPYNYSTDIYIIKKGNPNLTPAHSDVFNFSYTLTYKKWRINPFIKFDHTSDIITQYGSLDGDVYTSTYANLNHQNKFTGGAMINYTMSCGSIGGSFDYSKLKIPGMRFSGNIYSASIFSNIYYKKFSANINLSYYPYAYSVLSKSDNPLISTFTFYWRCNRALYLGLYANSLLFPGSKYKTWIENGDYRSYTTFTEKGLRPTIMFIVSYTFSNKIQQTYRQKKYIQMNDSGSR